MHPNIHLLSVKIAHILDYTLNVGGFLPVATCLGCFFLNGDKSNKEEEEKGGEKTQQLAFKLFVRKIKS